MCKETKRKKLLTLLAGTYSFSVNKKGMPCLEFVMEKCKRKKGTGKYWRLLRPGTLLCVLPES
jgi:hypothetical protein